MYLSRLWRWGCLPFRSISRRASLWPVYVQATLLAGGITMAFLCLSGESLYAEGRRVARADGTQAMFMLNQAAILFPYQYRNRETLAVIQATSNGIPPKQAIRVIKSVLDTDRHSPHLNYLLALQYLRVGDRDAASARLEVLERVAPGWGVTRDIKKMIEGLS